MRNSSQTLNTGTERRNTNKMILKIVLASYLKGVSGPQQNGGGIKGKPRGLAKLRTQRLVFGEAK